MQGGCGLGDDVGSAAKSGPRVMGREINAQPNRLAQAEGADYIGFGPIFATPTKPDYLPIGLSDIKRVHTEVSLPTSASRNQHRQPAEVVN